MTRFSPQGPESNDVKTAIAYLRISSDPDDRRLGVERQRHDVTALARRLRADLIHTFEDNDVSAFTERKANTGWGQTLASLERDRPTYLLVYKQDRIGRRLTDLEGLDELCRRTGTQVHAYEGGDVFANPAWPMLAAVAKMESQNTSIRIRRAFDAKRAKGVQPQGGVRPYGFKADRITIKPGEAKVIRDVADRILKGESTTSLVRWLNDSGVPTVTGARWTGTALRGILTNPRYAGDLTTGRNRQVIGKAAWRPILDRGTFDSLQGVLEKRRGLGVGRPPTASLLGGIARCGICLTPMVAHSSGRTSKPYLGYRCPRNGGGCGRVSRKRTRVDEHVVPQLLARIDLESLIADRQGAVDEVARLRKIERDLTWRLDEVRTAAQEDRLALEDAFRLLDAVRRQRESARRSLASARSRLAEAERATAAQERWETWTMDQRRAWIRDHTSAILIHPTGPGRREHGVEIRY